MSSSPFQPTRWSVIAGAGSSDPEVRRAALERLCAQYWHPLYAYLRRRGRSPEDAADLVQGLFAQLLGRDSLAALEERPGRFRNWLLTALQNHERDVRDRDQALKRGGGRSPIPIDPEAGERRLEFAGRADDDPRVAFDRAWAHTLLAAARDALEQEFRGAGRSPIFAALEGTLRGEEERPRSEIAAELGLSPVALRVTLHRMRARYRELLIAIAADSLGGRGEAGEELQALSRALGGGGGDFGESR